MMKKNTILLVLSLVLCCDMLSAQKSYTVENLPNTRLESDRNHVSNPDLIIDKTTEMRLDSLLSLFRDTADVFVAAVKFIDGDDINGFSNDIFNKWGIGDKDKDNGVLVAFCRTIK